MSTSTTTADPPATLEVSVIGLIAGISVIATVLIIVFIVAMTICIRNRVNRKKTPDRSHLYMVQENSPFNSLNSPMPNNNAYPGANPTTSNGNGYVNHGMSNNELRQNPLAENDLYPAAPVKPGLSMISLPLTPQADPYSSNRLAVSTQSLEHSGSNQRELRTFYSKIYEKLVDTSHEHKGRPLYLCKRQDYHKLSDYFDIIGKTRIGDWLVRPRPNVPNRPKPRRRHSKKRQAPSRPIPNPGSNKNSYGSQNNVNINGGFILGRPGSGVIATPFGVAERMPNSSYLAHSGNLENQMQVEHRYTSLPRDISLNKPSGSGSRAAEVRRRDSDRSKRLDEKVYAEVMRKHNISNTGNESPVIMDTKNPKRERYFNVIEETSPVQRNKQSRHEHSKGGDGAGHRERSGSNSTIKSLGITDQFKFLDQYETEEERF